jgi:hypothetical protein
LEILWLPVSLNIFESGNETGLYRWYGRKQDRKMNITYSLNLLVLKHFSADVYNHHQTVVNIDKNKHISGRGLPFADNKYDLLVYWFLFQIVQ